MSESKAMILGCSGLVVSPEEARFYAGEQPWGFILFARNVSEPEQIRDLVAALRNSVGKKGGAAKTRAAKPPRKAQRKRRARG